MIRTGLALAAAAMTAAASAHRAGPPPGHTGAFGEPDCAACHFDAIVDDAAGALALTAPTTYTPGQRHTLQVELRYPELAAGGFQLSARFTAGSRAGAQAGTLDAATDRTRIEAGDRGVLFASHTAAGVSATGGAIAWEVEWTAPEGGGPVAFDVAAQVANDDDSEFGERLYRARHVSHARVEK